MKLRFLTALVATTLVGGLSACASGSASPQSTEPAFDSAAVLEGYFNAINSNLPEQAKKAIEFAAPGSNAEAYAIEQSAHMQARMDGGVSQDNEREVVFEEDEVLFCDPGYDDPEVDRMDYCQSFSNFEFDGEKLTNFHAGDSSLDGRIVLGSETPTAIGKLGEAQVISSYETISGDLVIILEVKSSTKVLELPYSANYLTEEGRQTEAYAVEGVTSLKEGRLGNAAYIFTGAKIGGTLEVEFFDDDYNSVVITFPTQP